jgi:hypothetical protein
MHNRHEMLDLVIVNGKARGIIARNLITGEIERHSAHAVVVLLVDTETFSSCQQMQWVLMLQLGKSIKKRSVFCESYYTNS